MSPWDGMNRRRFPRVTYPCLVTIKGQQGEADVLLTHTENIGIGGLGIIIKKNLRMFSMVNVELDLMDLDEHVKCQGKVVWSIRRKSDEKTKPLFYDIGIEFVDLSEKDKHRMEEIVQRLIKQNKLVP